MSASTFLVHYAYDDGMDSGHKVSLFSVSGTTITLEDEIETFSNLTGQARLRKYDTDKAIICKSKSTAGTLRTNIKVIEISGTTLSLGGDNIITALDDLVAPDLAIYSTTEGALIAFDIDSTYELVLFHFTISGTTITYGTAQGISEITYNSSTGPFWDGHCIYETEDTNHLILVYALRDNSPATLDIEAAVLTTSSGSYSIGVIQTVLNESDPTTIGTGSQVPGGDVNATKIGKDPSGNNFLYQSKVLKPVPDGYTFTASICTTTTSVTVDDTDSSIIGWQGSGASIFGINGLSSNTFLDLTLGRNSLSQSAKCYAGLVYTTASCLENGFKVLGMSIGKFGGDYAYVTAWVNGEILLQLYDLLTLTLDSEYSLGIIELDDVETVYYAYPYAVSDSSVFIFGRLPDPGQLGLSHILYSEDFGATVTKIEGSWGADYCGALVTDEWGEYIYAIRCNASSSKLYTGEGTLSFKKTLPYVGPTNVKSLRLGEFQEVVAASGIAGQTQTVVYGLDPFETFEDVTYNHPQSNVKAVVIT